MIMLNGHLVAEDEHSSHTYTPGFEKAVAFYNSCLHVESWYKLSDASYLEEPVSAGLFC